MSASQGQQALRLVDTEDLIDIIILDLRMPVLDGFGVLDQMNNTPGKPSIPIVILSANITPDVLQRLRKYNVNAIIEKPFEMDDLIGLVNQILSVASVA